MHRYLLTLCVVIVVLLVGTATAGVTLEEGVIINLTSADVTITINNDLVFDEVVVTDSELRFNSSQFWSNWSLSPLSHLDVGLNHWNMSAGSEHYNYDVSTTYPTNPTNVVFQVEDNDTYYIILVNNSVYDVQESDGNGNISISYSDFVNDKAFTIKKEILTLVSPANNSNESFAFPPLTNPVTLAWSDIGAPSYHLLIGETETFSIITTDTYVTGSNTTVELLPAGTYYWKVQAYYPDDIFTGNWSVAWTFDILTSTNGDNETGIHGVVYSDGNIPLSGASVNIWNTTWSDAMVTGTNGYYRFSELAGDTTYSIQATKDLYENSAVQLVTTVNNTTTTKNIFLTADLGSYEWRHYVKFTVRSLWGTKYSGVAVNVYKGADVVPTHTGITGTDGSITFILYRNQEYRITFVDASQGIDEEITLYPKETEYNVYVYDTLLPDEDDTESNEIKVSITTAEINDTHAEISVTYTDAMAETTSLKIYVNQSDEDDPVNQTIIESIDLGATSITTHTFTISDYTGQAYFINVIAGHTTFGDVFRTYSVRFDGMAEDWGFSRIWVYMGVAGMMFIGGLFKASKAEQGALIVCVAGWLFIVMGWFDSLGSAAVLSMKAGLGLATIIAIMANMAKKDRDETV